MAAQTQLGKVDVAVGEGKTLELGVEAILSELLIASTTYATVEFAKQQWFLTQAATDAVLVGATLDCESVNPERITVFDNHGI